MEGFPGSRRRCVLTLAALLAVAAVESPRAQSDAYPSKPIKVISGFAAGGTNDFLARLVGKTLEDGIGARTIVENRTGANGRISTDFVISNAGDPHTLLLNGGATLGLSALLNKEPNYDVTRGLTSISMLTSVPALLVVNPKIPAKDVKEFVAYITANPQALGFGSSGTGGTGHIVGEMFKKQTKTNIVHVPYRGDAPAVTDVVSGQIPMAFIGIGSVLEFVKSGHVKALAVSQSERSKLVPDVPTFREMGIDNVELTSWYTLMGPPNLPPATVKLINETVNKGLGLPETQQKLTAIGIESTLLTAEETDRFVRTEVAKYRDMATALGIQIQ